MAERRHPFDRGEALRRLADEQFDVLVIGGGATGAGVALDTASRGLRTALVERNDFAAGTSSLSSKMIHGGIRYLQQLDFGLVYQSLRERQRLLENAPHLVRVLPFVMAIYNKGGMIPRFLAWTLSPVLWFYDLTGGARIGHRHRRLGRDDTITHMPVLDADRIQHAIGIGTSPPPQRLPQARQSRRQSDTAPFLFFIQDAP